MESLNQTLFLWLNAPEHPQRFGADGWPSSLPSGFIWTVPLLIGIGWLRGSENTRKTMLVVNRIGIAEPYSSTKSSGLAWVASPAFHDRPGPHPHSPCCRFLISKRFT